MKKYSFPLLTLLLTAISAATIIPCHAQTPVESNGNTPNNEISTTREISTTNNRSELVKENALGNSTGDKSTVISETSVSSSSTSDNQATTQPNIRIPISSRIFAAPSMQQ
jgi:hypothetical protein